MDSIKKTAPLNCKVSKHSYDKIQRAEGNTMNIQQLTSCTSMCVKKHHSHSRYIQPENLSAL